MNNDEQIEYWNGDVGTTWARNHQQLDVMLDPLGRAGINALAIGAGHRVLDIGCGCGATTLAIAEQGATVTGVDISGPMLALASRRAEQENIAATFLQQDAATYNFNASFDRVFSRFGVMFFNQPVSAFTNIRRAMAPGGRLGFVCWRSADENAWIQEPMAIIMKHIPPAPPTDPLAPGPFAFADVSRINEILSGAGFTDIHVEPVDTSIQLGQGSAQDALDFIEEIGPAARLLADHSERIRDKISAELLALFNSNLGPQGVTMGAACWIVTAGV